MHEHIRQVLSHASIGTRDLERTAAFYDRALGALGCRRLSEHPGAVGYGRHAPELWVQTPVDPNAPEQCGIGVHIGFAADSRDQVDAFFQAALAAGGIEESAPDERPHLGQPVYAAFVRDPDGHTVEAAFRDEESPPEGGRA